MGINFPGGQIKYWKYKCGNQVIQTGVTNDSTVPYTPIPHLPVFKW